MSTSGRIWMMAKKKFVHALDYAQEQLRDKLLEGCYTVQRQSKVAAIVGKSIACNKKFPRQLTWCALFHWAIRHTVRFVARQVADNSKLDSVTELLRTRLKWWETALRLVTGLLFISNLVQTPTVFRRAIVSVREPDSLSIRQQHQIYLMTYSRLNVTTCLSTRPASPPSWSRFLSTRVTSCPRNANLTLHDSSPRQFSTR